MDASTSRTMHMRSLVAQAGGPSAWAKQFGGTRWVAAQVSQWISEESPKGIGNRLARDLESAMGLPAGAIDQFSSEAPPFSPPATPGGYRVAQLDAEAGMGGELVNADNPDVIREVDFEPAYIRALLGYLPKPGRLKLVTGRGNSMTPDIQPGDVVLVDTGCTTYQGDGIYLINMGRGQQFKALQDRPDGLYAVSTNPIYPPVPLTDDTLIGGKVYLRNRLERMG